MASHAFSVTALYAAARRRVALRRLGPSGLRSTDAGGRSVASARRTARVRALALLSCLRPGGGSDRYPLGPPRRAAT